jgi:hypothetical protein
VTGPGLALRAGLLLLTLIEAGQGFWLYLAPRSFYDDIPTVAADPPFNEHLLSDIGGLSLAMAVALGASAVLMERNLLRAALAGYIVYAVSHLLFHATHTGGLPATDAVALLTGLSLLPAFALGLLVLASRAGSPPGPVSPPKPGDPGSTPAGRDSRARSW